MLMLYFNRFKIMFCVILYLKKGDENMVDFKERIKNLRKEKNLTQSELAEYMGLKTYTTVSKWESGDNLPRGREIKMLSEFFNVSSDYILGISDERKINSFNNEYKYEEDETGSFEFNENLSVFPVAGKIAAGSPNIIIEDMEGYLAAPKTTSKNNELMYLRVTSDSMSMKFPVGSYALINTKADIENGDIAAVKINGDEATLKQVKFDESKRYITLIPQSHNPNYEPITIDLSKEELQIIGKAVGIFNDI